MKLYRKKNGSQTQLIEIIREEQTGVWFKFLDMSSGTEHFYTYEHLNNYYLPVGNFIHHPVGYGVHTIQVGDVRFRGNVPCTIKSIFVDHSGNMIVSYEVPSSKPHSGLHTHTSSRNIIDCPHLFGLQPETMVSENEIFEGEIYVTSMVYTEVQEVIKIGNKAVFYRNVNTGNENAEDINSFRDCTISAEYGLGKRLAEERAVAKNSESLIEY